MNWRAFLVVFLLPSMVLAQTPGYTVPYVPPAPQLKLDPIPPGDDVIVPLAKGKEAPFEGQLFDPTTALRWGNYLEQYRLRLEVCYQERQELSTIDHAYFNQVLRIEQDSSKRVVSDLEGRLKRVEEQNAQLQGELSKGPAWYNSRGFGVVIGVVGTVAVVGLSAWALNYLGN